VLCHATGKDPSDLGVCVTYPGALCRHGVKDAHTADFRPGRLHERWRDRPSIPPHQMQWSITRRRRLSPEELCGAPMRREHGSTSLNQGGSKQCSPARAVHGDFWTPQRSPRVTDITEVAPKRSPWRIQQAIRFKLFNILQASAGRNHRGSAKAYTGQAYEGHYFCTARATCCRS